jgi:hypothetical protein
MGRKQALEGRQKSLSPFQGSSDHPPNPGRRFACPGLLSFAPPARGRLNFEFGPLATHVQLNKRRHMHTSAYLDSTDLPVTPTWLFANRSFYFQ